MTDSPKSGDPPAEGFAASTPSLSPESDGDRQPVHAVRVQRPAGWREHASQLLPTRLRRQHLVVVVSLAVMLSAVAFSALADPPAEPSATGVAAETLPGTEPAPTTTAALVPSPSLSPSESGSPSETPAGEAATDAPAPSGVPTRTGSAPSSPAKPSAGSTQKCSTVQEVKLCSRIVGSGPFKLETSIYLPRAMSGTWVYSTGVEGGGKPTDELVHLDDLRAGSSSWTTACGNFTTMWSSFIGPSGLKIETKSVECP